MKQVAIFISVLAAILLVGLAAVALLPPSEVPRGPRVTNPRSDGDSFIASDGARLPFRVWGADSPINATGGTRTIVLTLHGAGAYSDMYASLGEYLAIRNVTTYAYDQRGHGSSPNFGAWAGTQSLIDDMNDVMAVLRCECPTSRLYIAGQSLGAAVILNAAARGELPAVEGVILISPAVNARRSVSRGLQLLAALGARIAPGRAVPRPPDSITGVSDNRDYQRALLEDPLYMKQFSLGLVYGALAITDEAMTGAERLVAPTMLLYGERDVVVNRADFQELSRRVAASKQVITYPEGYHALVVDNQRENVFRDIAAWIDRRGQ